MEALEIFPKTESASFKSERPIEDGTFSIEIELELLKLEAFILVGSPERLSWLSNLRLRAGEELPSFEDVSLNWRPLCPGKGMRFEDLLLSSFFCLKWGFKVQSELTLHF